MIKNQQAINDLCNIKMERNISIVVQDKRTSGLIEGINIVNKKILDIGSLDGYHACILAKAGAIVTASDIRPANLHCALYRALYHGIKDMKFRLLDMETMHLEVEKDEYDILFMSGIFYHLYSPYEVLYNIKNLFEYILIEGHIAEPNKHKPIIKREFNGQVYEGWEYKEAGFSDPRSSKDQRPSFWLTRDSLKQLFSDCNLTIIKDIYKDLPNPHGVRDCYLLQRNK